MPVPETLLFDLQAIPRSRPVALLMRHSHRFPITDPAHNKQIGLTLEGLQQATQLGSLLGETFTAGRLYSSPVGRCVDTANAIARGANWPVHASPHFILSHDHIESLWDAFAVGQMDASYPLQVTDILAFLLDFGRSSPGLDILVTHDTILCMLVGYLLGQPTLGEYWPAYLEGVFCWEEEGLICARWRGKTYELAAIPANQVHL